MKHPLVGKTFNRWTVVRVFATLRSSKGELIAKVKCSCGAVRRRLLSRVVRGRSTGCESCVQKRHGHASIDGLGTASPTYISWRMMKRRCLDTGYARYHLWGGRGITVHPEWSGPEGFERFLADVGERPSKRYSLDRIDVDGNYEPGNVRWATPKQQRANQRDPADDHDWAAGDFE